MIASSDKRALDCANHLESAKGLDILGLNKTLLGNVTAQIAGHTFLPSLMGPRSLVLDIGANRGRFTIAMSLEFGCRVHAVEANPYLCTDLRKSAIPGVEVCDVAIADTKGPRPFMLLENSESSHLCNLADASESVLQVDTVTLEELISEIPDDRIDLLKMDVEGAELEVLESVPIQALERVRQFTVEFHQFMHPASRLRIDAVKKRFSDSGFWVVDFSRTNYDVLFVHPSVKPSPYMRALIQCEKYKFQMKRGFSRWFAGQSANSR